MRTEKSMFFTQENVAFVKVLSVSQSTPTSNDQMMLNGLHIFAHEQILHIPIKKCVWKIADWNSIHITKA